VTTSVDFNNNLYFDLDINRLDTARPYVNGHNKRTLSKQLCIDNLERVTNELRRFGGVQRQRHSLQSRLNFASTRKSTAVTTGTTTDEDYVMLQSQSSARVCWFNSRNCFRVSQQIWTRSPYTARNRCSPCWDWAFENFNFVIIILLSFLKQLPLILFSFCYYCFFNMH
jgi:hypothetical protein